jgi:hypothetical protein
VHGLPRCCNKHPQVLQKHLAAMCSCWRWLDC